MHIRIPCFCEKVYDCLGGVVCSDLLCAIATTLVLMDLMDSNALLLVIVFTSAGILMYSALVQSSYGL